MSPVAPGRAEAGAVMFGVVGAGLTMTFVVPGADVQPPTVTVTLEVPVAAVVAPGIVGFCSAEAKPFGPVQE
jgi:hypothetical protein